jgi:hypothetical protein
MLMVAEAWSGNPLAESTFTKTLKMEDPVQFAREALLALQEERDGIDEPCPPAGPYGTHGPQSRTGS